MLKNNVLLLFIIIGVALALAAMNNYSQIVSKHLSAVHRMLVSTCRVVLVWMVDLFIYYAIPDGKPYGEDWDVYSWMQLGGFLCLIGGTALYVKSHLTATAARKSLEEQEKLQATTAANSIGNGTNGGRALTQLDPDTPTEAAFGNTNGHVP